MERQALRGPAAELTDVRSGAVDALLLWTLGCELVATAVLTAGCVGHPGHGAALAAAWGLVAALAVLAAVRDRLRWQQRAAALLALDYGALLLTGWALHLGTVALAHAVGFVVLAGLLLGGRASLVAAGLSLASIGALIAVFALGTSPAEPVTTSARLAALVGGLPPLVLVLVALPRIAGRQVRALERALAAVQDLEPTRSRLADAERAELVGRFAGALAHDLNNALTVVVANAEWLEGCLPDPEAVDAAAQIREAARNAATLTQQVLFATRRGAPQPRPLDLARVTFLLAGALRRLLPPTIQVETRGNGPVWATADPGRLQQLILRLAVNARTAMPGGGLLVLAVRSEARVPAARPPGALPPPTAQPVGPEPPRAQLEISDTGFGMDAEARRRAFEPLTFSRGDGWDAGPGLAGVKDLVDASGGEVSLHSEPGAGTTVTVSLPGAWPQATVLAPDRAAAPANILVVEDDIRVRAVLCTTLTEAGHHVDDVPDGTQAMRAIEELRAIDLLIVDLVMPGVPAGEVIATFRERHPRGRLLVCSAESDEDAVRRRVFEGEFRLLAKPFTRSDLLAAVEAALRGRGDGDDALATAQGTAAGLHPA